MNASFDTGQEVAAEQMELLSTEEEGVLAYLRGIIAGIRANGVPLELEAVKGALSSAGASTASRDSPSGSTTFHLHGTRILLRQGLSPRGGIEICFMTEST